MNQRMIRFWLIAVIFLFVTILSLLLVGRTDHTLAQAPTVQAILATQTTATMQATPATLIAPGRLEPITAKNASRIVQIAQIEKNVIFGLTWSPDSKTIALVGGASIGLYLVDDFNTGPRFLEGHSDWILSAAFSPDGTHLASGAYGTVRLWDTNTGQVVATLSGYPDDWLSVTFSPDGTRLVSGGYAGTVQLWNVKTGQAVATLHDPASVASVAFSPDGTQLAFSVSGDNSVRLWDGKTGQAAATLQGHIDPVHNVGAVVSVAFSPDGTRLAAGSIDGTVQLWDVKTQQVIATFQGHTGTVNVNPVAFSPDDTLLASGSNDETVRLWDVKTSQAIATLPGHTGFVDSVAFSPNGLLLASSDGGTMRLWGAPAH